MKFKSPYSEPGHNYAYKRRYKHTLKFMNNQIRTPVLVTGKKVDFEAYLEEYFGEGFDYTNDDLNEEWICQEAKGYNTILCFQVIEHLLNPLLFLQMCNRYLDSDDGLLYISYPTHGSKMFWSSGHFHEYDRSRFEYLIREAGFGIRKYESHIMWRRIKGFRSIIRNTPVGWCRHHYYCLQKGN